MMDNKRKMKAMMRTDHAKPTVGKSRCKARGNTMPPIEPPVAANPVKVPRRAQKKWAMAETAGVKRREVPRPQRMENVRIKCQYTA